MRHITVKEPQHARRTTWCYGILEEVRPNIFALEPSARLSITQHQHRHARPCVDDRSVTVRPGSMRNLWMLDSLEDGRFPVMPDSGTPGGNR
jgi:hypothetical protein